jgi:hypothetical protein
MNAFVVPEPQKAFAIPAEDNMPDRHGLYGELPPDMGQQPAEHPSFCFEHAGRYADRPAGGYDKKNEHDADA